MLIFAVSLRPQPYFFFLDFFVFVVFLTFFDAIGFSGIAFNDLFAGVLA